MAAAGGDRELQLRLAAKLEEAKALRSQIERGRLDAQQLRLRLQAAGLAGDSFVPARLGTGIGRGCPEAQCPEVRSTLQWLADCVDLERHVVLDCGESGCEVQVGKHRVQLGRMAAWSLATRAGAAGLKLTVPLDMQADTASLIAGTRAHGHLDELRAQRLADAFELVGGEIACPLLGAPTPAIFLIRKGSTKAMIIGSWPEVSFATKASLFDPARHFKWLGEVASEGCQGNVKPSQPHVCAGDRVKAKYGSRWFSGVLRDVKDDRAHVQCDVDAPGVITVAPLGSVRPSPEVPLAEQKKLPRHRRAHSMG